MVRSGSSAKAVFRIEDTATGIEEAIVVGGATRNAPAVRGM
jgi:hypothetical protein